MMLSYRIKLFISLDEWWIWKLLFDIGEFDFEKSLLKLYDEEDLTDADGGWHKFEKKLEESLKRSVYLVWERSCNVKSSSLLFL